MKKIVLIGLIILATHIITIRTLKVEYSDTNVVILSSFGINYEYYRF